MISLRAQIAGLLLALVAAGVLGYTQPAPLPAGVIFAVIALSAIAIAIAASHHQKGRP